MREMEADEKVSFWAVLKSVGAAFFGVQSGRNRERDFRKGKPVHFILVGLLATGLFVLAVFTVVRIVLWQAGV